MIEKIQNIIDSKINPILGTHNGYAEVTYFENGVCGVKLLGACAACMSATETFDSIVSSTLLNEVPEIKAVEVDQSVSEELLDFARSILQKEKKVD